MLTKHEKRVIFLWSHPAAAKRVLKANLPKSFLDIYKCPKKSGSKMRAYIAVACFGVLLTMLTMLPKTQKEQKVSVSRSVLGVFGQFWGCFWRICDDKSRFLYPMATFRPPVCHNVAIATSKLNMSVSRIKEYRNLS